MVRGILIVIKKQNFSYRMKERDSQYFYDGFSEFKNINYLICKVGLEKVGPVKQAIRIRKYYYTICTSCTVWSNLGLHILTHGEDDVVTRHIKWMCCLTTTTLGRRDARRSKRLGCLQIKYTDGKDSGLWDPSAASFFSSCQRVVHTHVTWMYLCTLKSMTHGCTASHTLAPMHNSHALHQHNIHS